MIQRYEKIFAGSSVRNREAKKEIRNQISLGVAGQKNLKFTICGWPIIRV